ncbi:MAG: cytochrome c oxidase subunit 3 [Flavobacteriales bacterium]|nr:cytochrome c oxidase subunit 3 [Flavobacteriales bacterium]
MESTALSQHSTSDIQRRTARSLLWVGIVSIIMLFAGLTSGYIVRQAEGDWLVVSLPSAFWWSTLIIVLSSATMWWGQHAIKKGNTKLLGIALGITLSLGLLFMALQFLGWNQLVQNGIYMTGPQSNVAGSFLYVIPGLHLAHLIFGLFSLAYTRYKVSSGAYSAQQYSGVSLTATYWHFLDFLWVYLFFFLLYIR